MHGPVFHKVLLFRELEAGSGWLFELQPDIEWISQFQPTITAIPTARDQWTELWATLRACKPWKAWIKRASRKYLLQKKIAWEVESYHAAILNELQTAGLTLCQADPEPPPNVFTCRHCPAQFPSYQQRALHEFRLHQILAEERYLVQSTVCGGCLKDFHSTFRVTQHLRYRLNLCWSRLHGAKAPDAPVHIGCRIIFEMYRDYRQFAGILDRYGPSNITVTANVFGHRSPPC